MATTPEQFKTLGRVQQLFAVTNGIGLRFKAIGLSSVKSVLADDGSFAHARELKYQDGHVIMLVDGDGVETFLHYA